MANEYTHESIRLAMMEQICQGLEGHRPRDFKPYASPHPYHIMFQCVKCKLYVNVRDMELELKDPRATPPYP